MVKFLLIVLLVSFVLRTLVPWLLRFFLGRLIKEQFRGGAPGGSGGFGGNASGPRPASEARRERATGRPGEVQIAYAPPPKERKPNPKGYRGGEYVEFEEVR